MDPHSKSNQVKHIPDGYHTVTPFLVVTQAALLIEFIKNAFRGEVVSQMDAPDGKIMHATMKIGDSLIMLSDANEKLPPMPCMLYLYVDEVDSFFMIRPLKQKVFHSDRLRMNSMVTGQQVSKTHGIINGG